MAQHHHLPSSSHSGGGISCDTDRSRNVKLKKLPQRGLGVAQLEKIRLEEQIKRNREAATVLANNSISIHDAAPCLALRCPSLSPSPPNFHFRSPPSVPIRIYGGVEDSPLQSISSSGNGGWCRNLQLESNAAAMPLPLPRRFFHFQHPASPLLNSCSNMEPPSNQNVHANNYALSWSREYKMVGVKRAYPFSLETPPPRSFTAHFDPSKSRFDELPSCSSRYTAQMEPRNIYMSSSISREVLNGDFLTLSPPTSNSKHKFPMDNQGCQGFKGNFRNQVYDLGQSRSREQPFSIFPVRSDIDESSACVTDANGENGETIDLNLKL